MLLFVKVNLVGIELQRVGLPRDLDDVNLVRGRRLEEDVRVVRVVEGDPADAGEVGMAAHDSQDVAGHSARLLVVLEVAAGLEDRAVRVDNESAQNLLRHGVLTEGHFSPKNISVFRNQNVLF